MIETIKDYCKERISEFNLIPDHRKELLLKLTNYIKHNRKEHKPVMFIYVCTHNSRRSHFGQIWGQIAAAHYNIGNVYTFSGGTEVTAFNPNAVSALKRIGFGVSQDSDNNNPKYNLIFDESKSPLLCFSKLYNDDSNPQSEFVAVMTCGDAEKNCPFISGADLRINCTYEDPKMFDNTDVQDKMYDERCKQIARESLFVFSRVNEF